MNWTDSEANWDADANKDEDDWDDWDDCDADWIDWDKFDWDAYEINRIWLLTYDDPDDSKSVYWLTDSYDD